MDENWRNFEGPARQEPRRVPELLMPPERPLPRSLAHRAELLAMITSDRGRAGRAGRAGRGRAGRAGRERRWQSAGPVDRLPPGTARRARQRWIAPVAAATAVAAVAIGMTVVVPRLGGAGGQRHVPSWALPWPDHRNGTVPLWQLDQAVSAWRRQAGIASGADRAKASVLPARSVIWYDARYIAGGRVAVIVFESDSPDGRRLVAGWAPTANLTPRSTNGYIQPSVHSGASRYDTGTGPGSPWFFYDIGAPRPVPGLAIGINAQVSVGSGSCPDHNCAPYNWITVLAAPDVTAMSWSAPVETLAGDLRTRTATTPADHGLIVANTGHQLVGQVTLTGILAGPRNTLAVPVHVGLPGNPDSQVPALAQPGQIPFSWPAHGIGVSWQGNLDLKAGLLRDEGNMGIPHNGRTAFVVRCLGQSPLLIAYKNSSGQQVRLGTVRCDRRLHTLTGYLSGATDVLIRVSNLTAYRLYAGATGP